MVEAEFTGKERGVETGLGYFEALHLSETQGPFTTPDLRLGSANPLNLLSWDLYTCHANNPLRNRSLQAKAAVYGTGVELPGEHSIRAVTGGQRRRRKAPLEFLGDQIVSAACRPARMRRRRLRLEEDATPRLAVPHATWARCAATREGLVLPQGRRQSPTPRTQGLLWPIRPLSADSTPRPQASGMADSISLASGPDYAAPRSIMSKYIGFST